MYLAKIKSSALQYALVSSVLIAIIVFAFLSLFHFQKKIELKNDFYKQSIENVALAFSSLSVHTIPYNTTNTRRFSTNPLENTSIIKKKWGVFDLVFIASRVKKERFEKVALMGTYNTNRKALYLADNQKPLVLAGTTKIVGDVLLPKSGVKSGYINGKSYKYNQLIFGKQYRSKQDLPKINYLDTIRYHGTSEFKEKKNVFLFKTGGTKIVQSFSEPLQSFYFNEPIALEHIELIGHQCIYSEQSISLKASAKLEDVILIAPIIKIESGTKGCFQAFASQQVIVGKNCKLNYPSAIVVNTAIKGGSNKDENKTSLYIDKETTIRGVVIYNSTFSNSKSRFTPQVFLSQNSTIMGEVYCNRNLELLGDIYGSVITKNFITKQSGSIYVNSIFNGQINLNKLPKEYCGLSIGNTNKLKVAKWLY